MPKKIEYIEVEGIKCEVKNPRKRKITEYYQSSLNEEIDKYISSIERWSESSRNYRDNLRINVKIAPFVLGWLRKPTDEDEYRVITGRMTMDEMLSKRKKESNKDKKTKKTKKPTTKRPVTPKKPTAPKKPAAPKKPTVKSIAKTKIAENGEKKSKPVSKKTTTNKKTSVKNEVKKGVTKASSPKKPATKKTAAKKATPKRVASKTSKK